MIDVCRLQLAPSDVDDKLFKLLQQHVPKIIITDDSWTVGSFKHNGIIDGIIEQIAW